MSCGAALKRRRQSLSLITTTGWATDSYSLGRKNRPSNGRTLDAVKNSGDTIAAVSVDKTPVMRFIRLLVSRGDLTIPVPSIRIDEREHDVPDI